MLLFAEVSINRATASGSTVIRVLGIITKALVFSCRLILALAVLTAVCLAWLLLFLAFAPFILLTPLFTRKKFATESAVGSGPMSRSPAVGSVDNADSCEFVFDRRRDISKLFGCNTRNVQYRWNLFAAKISHIKNLYDSPSALDFGAGSLRDSYELARLGFCVTSVDLNQQLLERYHQSYDWSGVRCPPRLFSGSLHDLRSENQSPFHLAIAFDVIEHLEEPADYCNIISSLLQEAGLLLTIVPNKRSIFERYFKHSIKHQRARGTPLVPGVPHLQFKSPEEWKSFFEQCGFKILEHDMAIGFFVNDGWNGLLGLPLRVYVAPVLTRLAMAIGLKFNASAFEEAFSPKWLMKRVDLLDQLVKNRFASRFGWNLIVAQKSSI